MKRIALINKKTSGFSLVELMVAITISLIVLAAVSTLFVSSKKTYTTQDRLGRLQENARFAMHFITRDLRLAGYTGCINKLIPDATYYNRLNVPALPALPKSTPDIPLVASDTTTIGTTDYPIDNITISFVDPVSSATLNAEMASPSSDITATNVTGISKGDMLIISDCSTADLFQVSDISTDTSTNITTIKHQMGATNPSPGNFSNDLSKAYKATAKFIKFSTRRYYIDIGASGNPALFRADNGGAGTELVDGIESLKILYGEDTDAVPPGTPTDGVPNTYRRASAVGNMRMVTSARIGILARTVNEKDTDIDNGLYDVDGDGVDDVVNPNDRNIRRIFRSTVQLRNLRCKQEPSPATCQKS
jgi:type IV pilus assembly protein PilW